MLKAVKCGVAVHYYSTNVNVNMIYLQIKAQLEVKIQQDGRNRRAEKSALTTIQKQKKYEKNVKYNKR